MPLILGILLFITFSSAEDFITPLEYGKMLYQNPRGIGCDKCHGLKGEGRLIATYVVNKKRKKLFAPRINNIPKAKFVTALSAKSNVMPTYFLTKNEIKSLYYYIMSEKNKSLYLRK